LLLRGFRYLPSPCPGTLPCGIGGLASPLEGRFGANRLPASGDLGPYGLFGRALAWWGLLLLPTLGSLAKELADLIFQTGLPRLLRSRPLLTGPGLAPMLHHLANGLEQPDEEGHCKKDDGTDDFRPPVGK
jgi:hypothetical protein